MRVSIKCFGYLRNELGTEESYDVFSESKPLLLSEILKELSNRKGEKFHKTLYREDGSFHPYITVILNGQPILNDQIVVDKDCSIFIMPFVDGG